MAAYDLGQVRLEPGDSMLFITDGLTEAYNPHGEQFGMERLVKVCEENHAATAEALLRHTFAALDLFVDGHPQHDDMTAAVLKFDGRNA